MITVSVSTAVQVFLIVTVAFILILWLLLDRQSSNGSTTSETKDHVWKCPICGHVYLETKPDKLSQCPECGSINTEQESEKVDLKQR